MSTGHIVMTPQAPSFLDIKFPWICYLLFSRLQNMYLHLTILLSSDLAFPWTITVCPVWVWICYSLIRTCSWKAHLLHEYWSHYSHVAQVCINFFLTFPLSLNLLPLPPCSPNALPQMIWKHTVLPAGGPDRITPSIMHRGLFMHCKWFFPNQKYIKEPWLGQNFLPRMRLITLHSPWWHVALSYLVAWIWGPLFPLNSGISYLRIASLLGKKDLQNTYLIKDFHPGYLKNS